VEHEHALGEVVGNSESRVLGPGITVVIPSIPPRRDLLKRAVASAINQIYPAAAISVAVDVEKRGAWHTRNRALAAVQTEWTAFLDDDDEFLPEHLNTLNNSVVNHEADMAYSWFSTVPNGSDPFPPWFADAPWDPEKPRHTTIVMLVRTRLAQSIAFTPPAAGDSVGNEDWRFILELNRRGKIVHVPQRTWLWHHDSKNTSGRPERW
jgi:glycosyltransferase involved in cell wall biosynthesis